MTNMEQCVIIGAGPIGLACAVHMTERGFDPLVLEAGKTAGANIQSWGHVQMFTPWALNLDELSARWLADEGWDYPDLLAVPTGHEFVRDYLIPLSQIPLLRTKIRYGARVTRIRRQANVFDVETADGTVVQARTLLDCGGTFANKRSSTLLSGRNVNSSRIFAGIPDFADPDTVDTLSDGTVAVVGGGHSALSSMYGLLLQRQHNSDLKVIWLLNSDTKDTVVEKEKTYFKDVPGSFVVDALHALDHAIKNDLFEVLSGFELAQVEGKGAGVSLTDANGRVVDISSAIINIGFFPDYGIYEDVEEPSNPLACIQGIYEHIKPSENTCLTVREQALPQLRLETDGHFVLGQKSYGSAPTFLLRTGYGQVDAVVTHLAGSLIGA